MTRQEMMKLCQSGDKQKRIHSFEQIEAKIKPVMRYFFQETFLLLTVGLRVELSILMELPLHPLLVIYWGLAIDIVIIY